MSKIRAGLLRRGSIGRMLLGTIAGLVTLIVASLGYYFPDQQRRELRGALEQKAKALAILAAHDAAPSLDFGDAEAALAVFRGLAADPDFHAAMLLGDDGITVKAELNGAPIKPTKPVRMPKEALLETSNGHILATVPVKTKADSAGIVLVTFSTEGIETKLDRVRFTTLVVSVTVLLLGLIVGYSIARSLVVRLERLVTASERVARGDLTLELQPDEGSDEISRMNAAFALMLESQRRLVRQIGDTAVQLSSSAGEFAANAKQQERGASEQTSAVTETRRTMQTLLDSAREIANTAQSVLSSAERSQHNSQIVADRIATLTSQTQRITEILEVIKDIANKSDLLALNAALEGTKAGEAGKGFSLVAGQMQRLAENVMGAVKDIKELTASISTATQATVLATEESTKIAADTTKSARQIALIIQQQRSGTEQVSAAMELVSDIATQTATGSKEIVASTSDLRSLTEKLQALVGQFHVEQERAAGDGRGER